MVLSMIFMRMDGYVVIAIHHESFVGSLNGSCTAFWTMIVDLVKGLALFRLAAFCSLQAISDAYPIPIISDKFNPLPKSRMKIMSYSSQITLKDY